jgi:hypothetical protein
MPRDAAKIAEAKTVAKAAVNEPAPKTSKAKEVAKTYMTGVWEDFKKEIPNLFKMLAPDGEVILSERHAEASKEIMAKIEGDAMALKRGEITRAEFTELIRRRKAAIFTLYSAEKISRSRPSEQKILAAIEKVAEILVTRGIPIILGLL